MPDYENYDYIYLGLDRRELSIFPYGGSYAPRQPMVDSAPFVVPTPQELRARAEKIRGATVDAALRRIVLLLGDGMGQVTIPLNTEEGPLSDAIAARLRERGWKVSVAGAVLSVGP